MSALPKTPQMYPTTVIVENGPQNPPESPNNNEGSQIFLVIMNIINSLTHMLLGCIVMSAFIYANVAGASTFKQHIYLCVFGVSLCFFDETKTKNMRNREKYTNFKNNCCAIKFELAFNHCTNFNTNPLRSIILCGLSFATNRLLSSKGHLRLSTENEINL